MLLRDLSNSHLVAALITEIVLMYGFYECMARCPTFGG